MRDVILRIAASELDTQVCAKWEHGYKVCPCKTVFVRVVTASVMSVPCTLSPA